MDEPVMDLAAQEKLFMQEWEYATDAVMDLLHFNRQLIGQLGLKRLREGFEEYGETIFLDENSDTLWNEIQEELADAVVYEVARRWHVGRQG